MTGIQFRPDGPHSDDYTTDLAHAFAETVRVLNHATQTRSGLGYPATVYTVVGALAAGAHGLGQLLHQLAVFLEEQADAGRLADDSGADPAVIAGSAQRNLGHAIGSAAALAHELSLVQSTISGLSLTEEEQ